MYMAKGSEISFFKSLGVGLGLAALGGCASLPDNYLEQVLQEIPVMEVDEALGTAGKLITVTGDFIPLETEKSDKPYFLHLGLVNTGEPIRDELKGLERREHLPLTKSVKVVEVIISASQLLQPIEQSLDEFVAEDVGLVSVQRPSASFSPVHLSFGDSSPLDLNSDAVEITSLTPDVLITTETSDPQKKVIQIVTHYRFDIEQLRSLLRGSYLVMSSAVDFEKGEYREHIGTYPKPEAPRRGVALKYFLSGEAVPHLNVIENSVLLSKTSREESKQRWTQLNNEYNDLRELDWRITWTGVRFPEASIGRYQRLQDVLIAPLTQYEFRDENGEFRRVALNWSSTTPPSTGLYDLGTKIGHWFKRLLVVVDQIDRKELITYGVPDDDFEEMLEVAEAYPELEKGLQQYFDRAHLLEPEVIRKWYEDHLDAKGNLPADSPINQYIRTVKGKLQPVFDNVREHKELEYYLRWEEITNTRFAGISDRALLFMHTDEDELKDMFFEMKQVPEVEAKYIPIHYMIEESSPVPMRNFNTVYPDLGLIVELSFGGTPEKPLYRDYSESEGRWVKTRAIYALGRGGFRLIGGVGGLIPGF